MKILVTGMTGRMCGNERRAKKPPLYGRMQAVMYADELDAMGHDVHQGLIEWGEDLSGYDKIFVGITLLSSLTCGHFLEMAWILYAYPEKVILYVEDWSVEKLTHDWLGKLSDENWRKHLKWRGWDPDDCEPWGSMARGALLRVITGDKCPWRVVASMFPWGDHGALMGPSYDVVALDVSPLIEYPRNLRGEIAWPLKGNSNFPNKERRWVLGALSEGTHKWADKQGFSWPVVKFGRDTKIPERELVQHYATNWGVLCPPYKKSGTGWWRNRYNWSAHVGSILLCHESDGWPMGDWYCCSARHIESASDATLREIAANQREFVQKYTWSREQFRDEMGAILSR